MTPTIFARAATSLLALALAASALPAQAGSTQVSAYGTGAYVSAYKYGGVSASDGGDLSFNASKTIADHGSNGDGYAAFASASLGEGALHASALASQALASTDTHWQASAIASMWDTVHWLGPDKGPLEAATLVPLDLEIDGSLHGIATARARVYFGYDNDYDIESLPWIDLSNGTTRVLDNLFIPLTPDPMYVFVQLDVEATGNGGIGSADFSHTLHVYFDLPDDVTAVTASGAQLQRPPVASAAVPEPAAWALMLTGFFGAGAALRRRRAFNLA